MIDWKRKLTSRKLWMAIVGFVTALLAAFNVADEVAVQVAAVIMAFATVISYILAEGWVDASRESGDIIVETTEVVDRPANDYLEQ